MNLYTPISIIARKILFISALILSPWRIFLILNNKIIIINWNLSWINSASFSITILNDPKGVLFSSIVLLISASVIIFSNTYIRQETYINRFSHLVFLFILSINILIYIPNIFALLLGWDGLGLVSFLLIIYYQNPKSFGAGIITALSNRIGDVIILLSIAWSLNQGHWNILNIWESPIRIIIILSIIIAGITKSAQIPFSSWLPAAIAAPTPVSALVHSSTLVTAGVFLLIRFYPFLSSINIFSYILLLLASLTIIIAGIVAIVEQDLKKIIALSTLRQLGVIITSIALGLPNLAFFHLITHALFKALLFICAGTIINFFHHTQDLRQIRNAWNQLPLTTATLLTANIALCGAPFLSGFFSKDLILETTLFSPYNWFIVSICFIATALTARYSIRIIICALWRSSTHLPVHNINNRNLDLTTPALILSFGAITFGTIINWLTISPNIEPFINSLEKFIALLVRILGGILAWKFSSKLFLITPPSYYNTLNILKISFLTNIWFLTSTTTQKILHFPIKLFHINIKTIDQGWIESLTRKGRGKFLLI